MINSRHLIFPVLFFTILLVGGILILRTAEDQVAKPENPVYLESAIVGATRELTTSNREKAHQTYTRFASSLAEKKLLTQEELGNIEMDLSLGDALYREDSWIPSNRAFERVLEQLAPLLAGGLGKAKALELEGMFTNATRQLDNEIYYGETDFIEVLAIANQGYNELQQEDWVSAIQSFSRALDQLVTVKKALLDRADTMLSGAEAELDLGNAASAISLYQSVLEIFPGHPEALNGLRAASLFRQNLQAQAEAIVRENRIPEPVEPEQLPPPTSEADSSIDSRIAKADWHFYRRELRESLSLYLDAQREYPNDQELAEKISEVRSTIQTREIAQYLDRAEIHYELGNWRESVATYRHILNVTPGNGEAREGWENSYIGFVEEKQVHEYKQLINHLIDKGLFKEAQTTLNEARTVLADVSMIQRKFASQDQYLRQQKLPVSIILRSDGKSWVSIPGSMAPERFLRKEVTVLPGRLSFIAWRKGFARKTTVQTFVVSTAPEEIMLYCDEEIKWFDYSTVKGPRKVAAALKAFDMQREIFDLQQFTRVVRIDGFPVNGPEREADWDIFFFTQIYNDLSRGEQNRMNNMAVDSRSNYIKAPSQVSRREIVEYGQYLMVTEGS